MKRLALAGLAASFLLMSIPQTAEARHWDNSWYYGGSRYGVVVNPYVNVNPYFNPYNTYVNTNPYTYYNPYFNPYGYSRTSTTERIINRVLRGIGL